MLSAGAGAGTQGPTKVRRDVATLIPMQYMATSKVKHYVAILRVRHNVATLILKIYVATHKNEVGCDYSVRELHLEIE